MLTAQNTKLSLLFPLLLVLLAGCATHNPLDLTRVDSSASPGLVRQDIDRYRGRTVQWGGLIVNRSEEGIPAWLEILSYPLHDDGNPDEYREPTGLFRFNYTGPMELAGHKPGLFVTVVGEITGLNSVDAAARTPPLPQVTGDQLHLWGWRSRDDRQPRTSFGFGLGLHF